MQALDKAVKTESKKIPMTQRMLLATVDGHTVYSLYSKHIDLDVVSLLIEEGERLYVGLSKKISKIITFMKPAQYSLFKDEKGQLKKYGEEEDGKRKIDIKERAMTNEIIDRIVQNDWQICYVFFQVAILDPTFTLSKIILDHQFAEKLCVESPALFYMIFSDSAFEPFEITYFDEVWWDSDIPYVTFFDKSCSIF